MKTFMRRTLIAMVVINIIGVTATAATIATETGRKEFGKKLSDTTHDRPTVYLRFVFYVGLYLFMWPISLPIAITEIRRRSKQ